MHLQIPSAVKRHRSSLLMSVVVVAVLALPLAGMGWKLYNWGRPWPEQIESVVPEEYWVIGPFGPNLHQSYDLESHPDPTRPYKGPGGGLRWERVSVVPGVQCLDFKKVFKKDHSSGYALTYIVSPTDQPGTLLLGSDDTIKVWVNGEIVHEFSRFRLGKPDEDQVPVRWREGRNTLLIKVGNSTGDHLFFAKCVGASRLVATTKPID